MSLKIYDDSVNYTAQVIKLPVKQKVEGLDNLVKVTVFGNDCLIGKDSDENELYLFFPAGAKLSDAFCKGNNLYRENQLNADPNKKGFFEPNGRVKAIKFRGVISTGFVIGIRSLKEAFENGIDKDWTTGTIAHLKEGDSFNEIDGVEICRKYVVGPGPSVSLGKGDRQSKINNRLLDLMIPNQFRFHSDTAHFANNLMKFQLSDIITITHKWHGSSCILSNVLIAKKLNIWQKFVNLLGGKIPDREYGYIYSSGKPKSNLPKGIEGTWINDGPDFYLNNIWKRAFDDYKYALEPGISLYGELVGFTEGGAAIQAGYDYGCQAGVDTTAFTDKLDGVKISPYRFMIYRITYTKPDGNTIEFSWQQIKNYCEKYSLTPVVEEYYGSIEGFFASIDPTTNYDSVDRQVIEDTLLGSLTCAVEALGNCKYCINKVPAEGYVIRIDGKSSYQAYKLKAKKFLLKESEELDKEIVNIEDNN